MSMERPQFWVMMKVLEMPVSAAKSGYHWVTPLRRTPLANSIKQMIRSTGCLSRVKKYCFTGRRSPSSEMEASPVSKSSYPAWLGVSRSQISMITQKTRRRIAGMKKSHQFWSTPPEPTPKIARTIEATTPSFSGNSARVASAMAWPQSKAK